MMYTLQRIDYQHLTARQQESYNFQKVSTVLADYGFTTIRLSDDWQGADFIAQHIDGMTFLKVQLKGRLSFYKKYQGKDLYICFPGEGYWYLYPHDAVLEQVLEITGIGKTESWLEKGGYSFPSVPANLQKVLEAYRLEG